MTDGYYGRATALKAPALVLFLLIVAATLILIPADPPAAWDPPFLNLALQIIFIGVASVLIAALAVRSFLRTGQWPVLWLGAGALTYGIGVPLSGALLMLQGANVGVTTHNLSTFLAGTLHFMGAFFVVNDVQPHETSTGRTAIVLQVYIAALAGVALVAVFSILGLLPPFFVQGQGGTPFRQIVLIMDVVLFFSSGLAFLRQYVRSRIDFLFWYSLGLFLITLGLVGVLIATHLGSALNWVGRGSQFVAGVYLSIAAYVTVREARSRRLPPDQLLASFFRSRDANLKLLFDSISDALVVSDRDFRITGWNAAAERAYGWTAAEVTGKPVRQVLQTQYPPGMDLEQAQRELMTRGSWHAEVVQKHRSGADVFILASVSLLRDSSGEVIGVAAVERDISERKKVEEEIARLNASLERRAVELEASNRELEAFAYSVSHDLRAPLRGIDGFSLALLEDYSDQLDEEGRNYLRMLRQNAQRMGDLIDDLLAFSRLGRQPLSRKTVALAEVAQRAWDELEADRKGREVEFRLGALPVCEADGNLVKQVFENLYSNALKFSRTRAAAVIETGCTGDGRDGLTLYVRDNGVGFDMQYHDKLFGVFQRLHRTEDYEGTGVGLAIVQRVVQRHGGRIWATGEVGHGATFYFTLGEGHCE